MRINLRRFWLAGNREVAELITMFSAYFGEYEPPPLDWRKFDDPCRKEIQAEKARGKREDLAPLLTCIESDEPRLTIIATDHRE